MGIYCQDNGEYGGGIDVIQRVTTITLKTAMVYQ